MVCTEAKDVTFRLLSSSHCLQAIDFAKKEKDKAFEKAKDAVRTVSDFVSGKGEPVEVGWPCNYRVVG